MFFLFHTLSIKCENSYSFVHLTSIMPGIKEVKHSTKTANSDSKLEDLHHDPPIYIVRTPLNQAISII